MEQVHQVILNMLVTKDLDNKVFDQIDPWSENLASLLRAIKASYQHTIIATSGKSVFIRYMLFNLTSVVNWRIVTAAKQQQVDIGNSQQNVRQVMHEYAIGDQVYVEMTGIYLKLNYKKQK